MKRTTLAVILIAGGMLLLANHTNAAGIKEGQWSMTTVIHMDGMDDDASEAMDGMDDMSPAEKAMMQKMMGGMKIGPAGGGTEMTTTMTQCLTNDKPVPAGKDKNCKQTHALKGNTVQFEETCANSHSTGQITYRNDTMKGLINSTHIENGKEVNVSMDLSGKYLGPCDQGASVKTPKLSQKELALKEKELDLKKKELDLQQKELELKSAEENKKTAAQKKSALEEVNGAVNTTNAVKNTFGGLRSLLGR